MLDRIVIAGAGRTIETILARLVHVAPVVVLDTVQTALDELRISEAENAEAPSPLHGVQKRLADATSPFVLEELRDEQHLSVAIVAATGDDRRNIEICRIAQQLRFQPVVGIVIRPETAQQYEQHGARAIVRAHILGNVVEQALRYDGLVMASSVGQGRGEIIEFSVLPSSPAIGVPLSQLHAEGWRIAAIYRNGVLVIPTGDTLIKVDDRVLVIGNPDILSGVAEQLRIGIPQFPQHYGHQIVVFLPNGRNQKLEEEAEFLCKRTRAHGLSRVSPGATPERTTVEHSEPVESSASPHRQRKLYESIPLHKEDAVSPIPMLKKRRPGLVMCEPASQTFSEKILGRGGFLSRLCNELECPILVSHGIQAYRRIVIGLVPHVHDLRLADTAIDLVRLLSIPLVLLRVRSPKEIEAPDPEIEKIAMEIERRTRLYGLKAETQTLEGNPVRELLRITTETDLLLVGRKRTLRDSFTSPDVALRVAREAHCSILVQTEERR
ncbi:MAG TPA: TrkA C-terminal domain-containing protein [Pseudomonadota bacterium]|nr:TrkA C-terminal domain-containing protein [Pseudomonadota bacterium]